MEDDQTEGQAENILPVSNRSYICQLQPDRTCIVFPALASMESRHTLSRRMHSRSLCLPPPKVHWPAITHTLERSFISPCRSIVEGDFEKHGLHDYHDDSLYEERRIISSAWPIEYFQYGCRKHDEGYIEREAG